MCFCKKHKYRFFGIIASKRLQRKYGVFLPFNTKFDNTLTLRHPTGIVIGDGVSIGKNVLIFQNVTLGRSDTVVGIYPSLGDDVIVYAGAVILGDVTIGRNSIIGANAVVTKDVPDNAIAVGVPARIIMRK